MKPNKRDHNFIERPQPMSSDEIHFSEREKEVIALLLRGKSNKQMALELGIAQRTVEFHLGKIYTKLKVTSRAEAILTLTETPLRESAGTIQRSDQRKSTVEQMVEPTENGNLTLFRRISMKKIHYLAGVLLAIVMIMAWIFLKPSSAPTPQPAFISQPTQPSLSSTPTSLLETETPLPLSDIAIQSHTVNGITAAIESYYVDTSHLIFQIRITGGEVDFGNPYYYSRFGGLNLYDANGNGINTSGGFGPAVDPALLQIELVPLTLFSGERLKGQLAFDVNAAPAYNQILAQFRFDFDLTIQPVKIFQPKQIISANGVDVLLDTIMISPAFTNVYLCFQPPSFADWNISSKSILQIGELQSTPYKYSLLFDAAIGGDRRAGSEPYWAPPIKDGRCVKNTFPIGSDDLNSFELNIPNLEQNSPDILLTDLLSVNYPGLTIKQAYQTYLEEYELTLKGPWNFTIDLQ